MNSLSAMIKAYCDNSIKRNQILVDYEAIMGYRLVSFSANGKLKTIRVWDKQIHKNPELEFLFGESGKYLITDYQMEHIRWMYDRDPASEKCVKFSLHSMGERKLKKYLMKEAA